MSIPSNFISEDATQTANFDLPLSLAQLQADDQQEEGESIHSESEMSEDEDPTSSDEEFIDDRPDHLIETYDAVDQLSDPDLILEICGLDATCQDILKDFRRHLNRLNVLQAERIRRLTTNRPARLVIPDESDTDEPQPKRIRRSVTYNPLHRPEVIDLTETTDEEY